MNTSASGHSHTGLREHGITGTWGHGLRGAREHERRGTVTSLPTGTWDHRGVYTRESDDIRAGKPGSTAPEEQQLTKWAAPLGNAARTTRVIRAKPNRQ